MSGSSDETKRETLRVRFRVSVDGVVRSKETQVDIHGELRVVLGTSEGVRGGVARMAPVLLWLIMVLCLLVSVVKYVMGIILKLSFPSAKVQKDYTYQPTVSVLMPCFNEGKTVYETIESISKSNYPAEIFEVIAQDDCSVDDSYEWMLKAQRDFTNIRIRTGRNSANSGKARTVCNAMEQSSAEVIISIDSDCIFHPDAISELDRVLQRSAHRIGRRSSGSAQPQ